MEGGGKDLSLLHGFLGVLRWSFTPLHLREIPLNTFSDKKPQNDKRRLE